MKYFCLINLIIIILVYSLRQLSFENVCGKTFRIKIHNTYYYNNIIIISRDSLERLLESSF